MTEETSSPPRARYRGVEAVASLFFNAIPLIGVVFWGWSAFAIVFLYWLENVAIGARTIISILTVAGRRGQQGIAGLLAALFFLVHYGLFCLVHGVFVVFLFGQHDAMGLFSLATVVTDLLTQQRNLAFGFISIVLWQFGEFLFFLIRSRVNEPSIRALMTSPYLRIGILHVTIIFGGFVLMMLGWPMIGVVALVLFKTAYDWWFANRGEAPKEKPAAG